MRKHRISVGVSLLCAVMVVLPIDAAFSDDMPAQETAKPAEASGAAVERPAVMTHYPHSRRLPYTTDAILDQRIRLLTAELDLTDRQQAEVRDVLVKQGAAIRKVWMDRSLTDGERGPITGAIGEKTADAIRDLLTPAQREKYNPPRPDASKPKPERAKDLSKWLDAFQQK